MVRYGVIVALCVVVLFPVYWMVLSTFQPDRYSVTYPPPLWLRGFDSSAFSSLFSQEPVAAWLSHSFIASAVTVSITVVLAVPGAFLLSRLRWRGSGAFGFFLLFTQLMPGAMVIVPELEWYRFLHWTNNLFALGVLYAAFNVPLGCWILKSSFDTVPNQVIEASFIDGCSQLGALRRILMPLSRPGLVAVGVVAFFAGWNDYLFGSALITSRSLYTASLGIATLGGEQAEAAGVLFSLLPVTLYMVFQRHIARGLSTGK